MLQSPKKTLAKYIPIESLDKVSEMLSQGSVRLIIHRARNTKLGDFRCSSPRRIATISVNGNLNVYAFLIVFLHEYAHWQVYARFGHKVEPHGIEWKQAFGWLLRHFCALQCFHPVLRDAIEEYSLDVSAAGLGSPKLQRLLAMFDPELESAQLKKFLEDLPMNALFVASNGMTFRKEEKLRKRYRCLCMNTQRRYLFQPMASVVPIDHHHNKS